MTARTNPPIMPRAFVEVRAPQLRTRSPAGELLDCDRAPTTADAYWCLGDVVGEEGRAFCGRELGTYVRIQACGFISNNYEAIERRRCRGRSFGGATIVNMHT